MLLWRNKEKYQYFSTENKAAYLEISSLVVEQVHLTMKGQKSITVGWETRNRHIWRLGLLYQYSLLAIEKAFFFIRQILITFLLLNENTCCGYSLEEPLWGSGYSLEEPWWGASNEYPQPMFSSRNKKNIMWIPLLSVAMSLLTFFFFFAKSFQIHVLTLVLLNKLRCHSHF